MVSEEGGGSKISKNCHSASNFGVLIDILETDAKEIFCPKIKPIIKIHNFYPIKLADIQSFFTLCIHKAVISNKFHKAWVKIVNLKKVYFWPEIYFASVSNSLLY